VLPDLTTSFRIDRVDVPIVPTEVEHLVLTDGRRNDPISSRECPFDSMKLARRLARFTESKPQVMICHAPPYGSELDQVREGLHAGSMAIKYFIESSQPDYFFCGHIHEAEGKQIRIGKTTAINVGKRGYLLEL